VADAKPILVLRACGDDGTIMGTGVSDSYPPAFQFPPVGEVFDWPGPELVKIPRDRPGANDHEGRQLHAEGIHGYGWGVSAEPEFADCLRYWKRNGMTSWLVLACRPEHVMFDKHRRSPLGKCRAKRGAVAYFGDLDGAVAYMRARWDPSVAPMPAWETSALFPPTVRPGLGLPMFTPGEATNPLLRRR